MIRNEMAAIAELTGGLGMGEWRRHGWKRAVADALLDAVDGVDPFNEEWTKALANDDKWKRPPRYPLRVAVLEELALPSIVPDFWRQDGAHFDFLEIEGSHRTGEAKLAQYYYTVDTMEEYGLSASVFAYGVEHRALYRPDIVNAWLATMKRQVDAEARKQQV